MNKKWDLDSIGYHVNFFTSATITYRKHNSTEIHKRKVKIKWLEYLFMDQNIHLAVEEEKKKLRNQLKNENRTLMANNYHKQNTQRRGHHELHGS
ncbi:hypothetical protein [Priestia megaterium]|uniref:hypothetical protein n=1 Tax=Priestia megaterium TaxID=1404 RepID=UPI0028777DA8|nr:hypothetical protein [Priestia megaterium]